MVERYKVSYRSCASASNEAKPQTNFRSNDSKQHCREYLFCFFYISLAVHWYLVPAVGGIVCFRLSSRCVYWHLASNIESFWSRPNGRISDVFTVFAQQLWVFASHCTDEMWTEWTKNTLPWLWHSIWWEVRWSNRNFIVEIPGSEEVVFGWEPKTVTYFWWPCRTCNNDWAREHRALTLFNRKMVSDRVQKNLCAIKLALSLWRNCRSHLNQKLFISFATKAYYTVDPIRHQQRLGILSLNQHYDKYKFCH